MTRCPPSPDMAEDWALFLDLDGTLLELVDDLAAVRASPDLIDLLGGLMTALGGALALVSGRDLATIDRIMAPGRFDAAGSHGAEWRLAGVAHAAVNNPAALAAAAGELERFVATCPGVMLERKALSLALHYRLRPEAKAQATQAAAEALSILGGDYRLMLGSAVTEIIPANADKGAAIKRFLACPPFRGRRPVFAGDDVTDESGFAAVNARDGMSIRVGGGPSRARYGLSSPSALRAWLRDCLLGCEP